MSATAARPRPVDRLRVLSRHPRADLWAFALLGLFALVVLYRKGVDTSFYYDDWDFVLNRHTGAISTFLVPHNEHFSLVPVVIYKILFATAGLDNYDPYRFVQVVLHVVVGGLVFLFARPRVGGVPALGAAALVLFLGEGFQDILWPFQIGFLCALAFGLGGFLLLERSTRAADAAALVLFGLSLASASIGIPMVIGAVAYLAMRPTPWRRAWVVGVPIVLYGLWYLKYGVSALNDKNITAAPSFTLEEIAGAVAALFGLAVEWGRPIALAAGAGLVWHMSRVTSFRRAFVGVLAIALSFWVLTALARAQLGDPTASRYVYPGGLFVLLIAAEALRGWRAGRRALWIVAVGVVLGVISSFQTLDKGADGLRETDQFVQAELTAVEIGAGRMDPGFAIDPERAPQLTAGAYLDAVRSIGSSPANSEPELASFEDKRHQLADSAFVRGYGLQLAAGSAPSRGPAPAALATSEATVKRRGSSCVVGRAMTPAGAAAVQLRVPAGGISLRAPGAAVSLRRYASGYGSSPPLAGDPTDAVVRIPRDRSPRPWYLLLDHVPRFTACGIGAGP